MPPLVIWRPTTLRTLLSGAIVTLPTYAGFMSDGSAEDATRTWHTDRMTFLDTPEFIDATTRTLNGAFPGTNKPHDAQKVSDEIVQMLFGELKEQNGGIHAETALATLGALAGFSVQMALRETLVRPGKMAENKVFAIVKTKNSETFYFGDLLNEGLFEAKPGALSVYAIVGGGVQAAGGKELPDIKDIAAYVAKTVGSDQFGVPRVPPEHMPHAKPIELLNKFWNPIRNYMVVSVQAPMQWPFVLALAAQKVIVMSKNTLDPPIAGRLVMETAIAMAKVDPTEIHYAYFQTY